MSEQNPDSFDAPGTDASAVDAIDVAFGTGVAAALTGGVDTGLNKPVAPDALPPNCLNCGAPVRGRYCIDCGQNTLTHVPTLGEVIGDGIVSLLNLDSRLWRTMGALLLRPGLLTQDFLAGRRARYVPPLRLYLVMSVLLFLVTSLDPTDNDAKGLNDPAVKAEVENSIKEALEADPTEMAAANPDLDLSQGVNVDFDDAGEMRVSDTQGNIVHLDDDNDCDEMNIPGFDPGDAIDTAIREACTRGAQDDFASMGRDFTDNIPLLAFLVIPLMAAVFKLLYVFAGRNYLAHLAFLCHTHAFTFMLVVLLIAMRMIGRTVAGLGTPMALLGALLILYMPAYYFLAMRRVYEQSVALTLAKQFALMVIYIFVVGIVFSIGFVVVMLAT